MPAFAPTIDPRRTPAACLSAVFGISLLLLSLLPALLTPRGAIAQDALPDVPNITARAVFSIDISANVELISKNADKELPPASTTKILTALVVVNNANLDDQVTIDPADVAQDGESSMNVVANDVLTVKQLLYGVLLPSGNDAARSLARYVGNALLAKDGAEGEPTARFVDEMNKEAASLGLKHTHFTNPDGLQDKNLYSSARDLATMAAVAMQNDVIAQIVDTPAKDITSLGAPPQVYQLVNTNVMLSDGTPGVHGVKTGGTSEAGACLVLATWGSGENHVITVILGSDLSYDENGIPVESSDKRYDDAKAILAVIDQNYQWMNADLPGLDDELAAWQVKIQSKAKVVVRRSGNQQLRYLLKLGPEVKANSSAGQVLFFIGSEQVAAQPVVQVKTSSGGSS